MSSALQWFPGDLARHAREFGIAFVDDDDVKQECASPDLPPVPPLIPLREGVETGEGYGGVFMVNGGDCTVVLDPLPTDLLRSLTQDGRVSTAHGAIDGDDDPASRDERRAARRRRRERRSSSSGGGGKAKRRRRSTSCSTTSSSDSRHRHKHRKHRRRRATTPPTPRVNPIFVWVKQDDTRIVEVLCEDYDKRNRIRLTKTPQGWRAIPRTERLAAAGRSTAQEQPQPTDGSTAPADDRGGESEAAEEEEEEEEPEEDLEPTDLSIPKTGGDADMPPRPVAAAAVAPPVPPPAPPASPPAAHQPKPQPKSMFLESLLSSPRKCAPPPVPPAPDSNEEPLDLGRGPEEDITLKNLLSRTPAPRSRLLELLTEEPDPQAQLKKLLADPELSVPDPLLVPRDRLRRLVASPAREIPQLLAARPELRLPEALACPGLLRDPDLLVVSLAHLQKLLTCPGQDDPCVSLSEWQQQALWLPYLASQDFLSVLSSVFPPPHQQYPLLPPLALPSAQLELQQTLAFWQEAMLQAAANNNNNNNNNLLSAKTASGTNGKNYHHHHHHHHHNSGRFPSAAKLSSNNSSARTSPMSPKFQRSSSHHEYLSKPQVACKSLMNLLKQEPAPPPPPPRSQKQQKHSHLLAALGTPPQHAPVSHPIDLSGGRRSGTLKVKQHLVDPAITPRLLKEEQAGKAHTQLWHPLFGRVEVTRLHSRGDVSCVCVATGRGVDSEMMFPREEFSGNKVVFKKLLSAAPRSSFKFFLEDSSQVLLSCGVPLPLVSRDSGSPRPNKW